VSRGQFDDAVPVQDRKAISEHQHRVGMLAQSRCERLIQVVAVASWQELQDDTRSSCNYFGRLHLESGCRLPWIVQNADPVVCGECITHTS
jgi:hypothetical protein